MLEDDNLWKEDLFAILGVTEETPAGEIRKVYLQLAKTHHPDRFPDDEEARKEALEKFSKMTVAYEVLSDETKRSQYLETRRLLAHHLAAAEGGPSAEGLPGDANEARQNQLEQLYKQGVKAFKTGDIDGASRYFKDAINLHPRPKDHVYLARCYQAKNWKSMALAEVKAALKLKPGFPEAASMLKELEGPPPKESLLNKLFKKKS